MYLKKYLSSKFGMAVATFLIATISPLCFLNLLNSPSLAQSEASFQLTSVDFSQGSAIPREFTCEGANQSPPLVWENVPEGTQSLALILSDPDAPDGTWIHWVIYNISPELGGLPASINAGSLPTGAKEGYNSWNRDGYGGPCPPRRRHRYYFRLYALDTILDDLGKPTAKELKRAMEDHVIGETELMGTFRR